MKIKLEYTLKLLSDWHVGSGLDAGTDVDALVLKTEDDLPFIPGKTIKGLLRDAAMDLVDVGGLSLDDVYGIFGTRPGLIKIDSKGTEDNNNNISDFDPKEKESIPGHAFFSNACLDKEEKKEIISHKLAPFLYRTVASTAINENGIALEKSLRSMEVCLPLELFGEIEINGKTNEEKEVAEDLLDKQELALKKTAKLLRHLGVQRNRGLGRCHFLITKTIKL